MSKYAKLVEGVLIPAPTQVIRMGSLLRILRKVYWKN